MKEKLLPFGAEPRYVGKIAAMQQISTYVPWEILLCEAMSWELENWDDTQVAWITHSSPVWACLPDYDMCCEFAFTEMWGKVVGTWKLLTFVFLLPLYSPHSVD